MAESIWSREVRIPERKPLRGDVQADTVVIGAGMAGILTAYHLQLQGIKTAVLEAERIGSGQTKNTTAKITSQHGLVYTDLVQKIGMKKAGLYAKANEAAVSAYERLVRKHEIACGFERLPSYLYARDGRERLEKEAQTAAELGINASFVKEIPLPFPTAGAVCFENQAQFHPLEFIRRISEELTVYEKTRVLSVHGHSVQTDTGRVRAEHIVFATHYPFLNVPGFYFMRQHQERSYVLALFGAERYSGMYYSADEGGLSFRNAGEYLLLGGGTHRTGSNVCGGVYEKLMIQAEKLYPGCEVRAKWSAQDGMPHDKIPFIGPYSLFRPYWYVASGFKKWGMTSSMIAAQVITDQICGKKNPYAEVFHPGRLLLRASLPALVKDLGISVHGVVSGVFHPRKRCPHMGCCLTWNPDEESYDCPCHGSRFDRHGRLIDNPAQCGMKNAE